MLEKRIIDVPFTAGPDDKINPHLRAAGQLSKLENCYQLKHGKVQKRGGQAVVTKDAFQLPNVAGVDLSAVCDLSAKGSELLANNNERLHTFCPESKAFSATGTWKDSGYCKPVDVSAKRVANGPYMHNRLDIAATSSHTCIAHSLPVVDQVSGLFPADIGGVAVTVIDNQTGAEVLSSYPITTPGGQTFGCALAAVGDGASFVIYHFVLGSNDLYVTGISCSFTSPAVTAATLVVSDFIGTAAGWCFLCAEGGLDATYTGISGTLVAYRENIGNAIKVVLVDSALAVADSYTLVGGTPHVNASLHWHAQGASSKLFVFNWRSAGTVYVTLLSITAGALGLSSGPTLVYTLSSEVPGGYGIGAGTDPDGADYVRVFFTVADQNMSEPTIRTARVRNTGAVSGSAVFAPGYTLLSRPFTHGSKHYVFAHVKGSDSTTTAEAYSVAGTVHCLLYNTGSPVVVARFLVNQHPGAIRDAVTGGAGWSGTPWGTNLVNRQVVVSGDTVKCVFSMAERSQLTTFPDSPIYDTAVVLVSLDFSAATVPVIPFNGTVLLGGGVLRVFDGNTAVMAGMEADHPNFLLEQGVGGALADGTYGVAVCYRWVDGEGNEYWSAPTFKTIVVAAGGGVASIWLRVTASTESWCVYNRITDKVSTLHQVDVCVFRTQANLVTHYADKFVNNVTTGAIATTVNIGLAADSDANISDNATLYTTGGALAMVLPPCPHHLATDGDTAALIPGDNRETIWVSMPIVRGMGVGFTDDLIYPVMGSGNAEALVFMDGRLIVLCTKGVRVMVGNPPSATGEGGYSGSEAITGAPGCIGWRSVVVIPQGIIYQSAKGFYLLARDLTASYIGAPVESYNAQTVKSAVVMEEINHARFVMSGGDVLVYDWDHGNWPRFTGLAAVASTVWNGDWVIAKSDATIGQETGSVWTDYGSGVITAKCRTGWLRVSALQGFERVKRLVMLGVAASQASPSDRLTVRAYYNFDETTATTLLSAVTIGTTASAVIEERITLALQKCTAIMVEFEWYSAVAKESLSLTGVSFEAGAKKGAPRLAPANTR